MQLKQINQAVSLTLWNDIEFILLSSYLFNI